MNQGNGKYAVLFVMKLIVSVIIAKLVVGSFEVLQSYNLLATILIVAVIQVVMIIVESKLKN